MSAWEHNEDRPPSMKDVEAILADLSKGERGNPPVLALNNRNLMKARNNGYPLEMYHETMEPVFSMTEKQTERLQQMGYVTHYIPRDYPAWVYRFNPDPKFEERIDLATQAIIKDGGIESRLVKTEKQWEALRKEPLKNGCGPWVKKPTEALPPTEEDPDSDLPPIKSKSKAA